MGTANTGMVFQTVSTAVTLEIVSSENRGRRLESTLGEAAGKRRFVIFGIHDAAWSHSSHFPASDYDSSRRTEAESKI